MQLEEGGRDVRRQHSDPMLSDSTADPSGRHLSSVDDNLVNLNKFKYYFTHSHIPQPAFGTSGIRDDAAEQVKLLAHSILTTVQVSMENHRMSTALTGI
jgi:hypothetical protein